MSTTIKVCPVCSVSWYAGKPEKHMMTCTAAAESALDRLKEAAKSDAWHKTVAVKDLALVLAVVDAAENAVGNVEDHQERRDLRQALEALTEDKP
jgi:DNA-directed RNA polymerase specialized sigma24 family protein